MNHVPPEELAAINERLKAMKPRYQMLIGNRSLGRTTALAEVARGGLQAGMEIVVHAPDEVRKRRFGDIFGVAGAMLLDRVTFFTPETEWRQAVHPSALRPRMLLIDDWSDYSQVQRNEVGELIASLRPSITMVVKYSQHLPADEAGNPTMIILAAAPTWVPVSDVSTHDERRNFEFLPDLAVIDRPIPWSWTQDSPLPVFAGNGYN